MFNNACLQIGLPEQMFSPSFSIRGFNGGYPLYYLKAVVEDVIKVSTQRLRP
jgi:hypothetical protein